jgi:hypothetical protein
MQKHSRNHNPNQKQVSFLAEKIRRLQTSGDSQEMMATIRDYLQNERQSHATQVYEHTAHTAQVVPMARLKAV